MAITALSSVSRALNNFPPPSVPTWRALAPICHGDIDAQDGGNYRYVCDTKVKGTPDIPVSRRVLLCDQLSGRVVRSAWSDGVTGLCAFNHIRLGVFYVLSFDHTGAFRAVVADGQIPEAMP